MEYVWYFGTCRKLTCFVFENNIPVILTIFIKVEFFLKSNVCRSGRSIFSQTSVEVKGNSLSPKSSVLSLSKGLEWEKWILSKQQCKCRKQEYFLLTLQTDIEMIEVCWKVRFKILPHQGWEIVRNYGRECCCFFRSSN